jgi:hypothetical protein
MKLIIRPLDAVNNPSPISEGVAELRINNQPCKGINLTTQHTRARRAPRVATVHDDYQRVEPDPPYPSVVFHAYASADTLWVARTLSHSTPVKYGGISSNSATVEATQCVGLHISCMCQYIIRWEFNQIQPTRVLINTGGGYHRAAPNLRSRPLSTFPSIFP